MTVPESEMCRVRRDARRGDDLVGVGGVVVAEVYVKTPPHFVVHLGGAITMTEPYLTAFPPGSACHPCAPLP